MKKIVRIITKTMCAIGYYCLTFFIPKDKKLWVFGCWKGRNFSDNSKALFEYVYNNQKDINAVWIAKNKDIYELVKSLGYNVLDYSSIKAKWVVMRAGANIQTESNQDTGSYRVARSKIIQLFHGFGALKEAPLYPEMGRFKKAIVKIYAENHSTSYWMLPSDYFLRRLPALTDLNPKMAYVTGQPRMDVLFEKNEMPFFESYRKDKKLKLILYAPTHRNYAQSPNIDFSKEDRRSLNEFCKCRNYILFFKPHPLELYKYINSFEEYSNLILLTNDSSLYPSDVNEYMHYFDLLISDYSSISTDFLVYDRPIVHFMYDIDSFENKNFTLTALETFQAGPICKSWEDLFKSIDEGLNGDLYSNLRMRARNNAFRYVDNNNCERVYKQICKILKLNDEQE